MTTPDPMTPSDADLLALEAQVLRLADPTQVRALDGALKAEPAPAALTASAALLADLRLAALLDDALAAEAAPAGLADRILAAAPLAETADVAGKIAPEAAVKGRIGGGGEWMRKPWRYAAVASISFSLSLMAVTFIVKKEASMLERAFGPQASSVSTDMANLQVVALASGAADEALMEEMEEAGAELELAGL